MNPSLKEFFKEEGKRVFTPDPFFHKRVMARIHEVQPREFGIWDVSPGSTRPVFGLALVLMLAFMAVQVFIPEVPDRGFMDALLEFDQEPAQVMLNSSADFPAEQEFLNQLMGFEELQ
jgi:hypothetical protein